MKPLLGKTEVPPSDESDQLDWLCSTNSGGIPRGFETVRGLHLSDGAGAILRGVLSTRSDRRWRARAGGTGPGRTHLMEGGLMEEHEFLARGVTDDTRGIAPLTELPGAMLVAPAQAISEKLLAMELELSQKRLLGIRQRLPAATWEDTPPEETPPEISEQAPFEKKLWEGAHPPGNPATHREIRAPSEESAGADALRTWSVPPAASAESFPSAGSGARGVVGSLRESRRFPLEGLFQGLGVLSLSCGVTLFLLGANSGAALTLALGFVLAGLLALVGAGRRRLGRGGRTRSCRPAGSQPVAG